MCVWTNSRGAVAQTLQGMTSQYPIFFRSFFQFITSYSSFQMLYVYMYSPTPLLSICRETRCYSKFIGQHFACCSAGYCSSQNLPCHNTHTNLHVVMMVPLSPYPLSLACDPSAQHFAKWEALRDLRSRLWSQTGVIPSALSGPWATGNYSSC